MNIVNHQHKNSAQHEDTFGNEKISRDTTSTRPTYTTYSLPVCSIMKRRYVSVIKASVQFGHCDQHGKGYADDSMVTSAQALENMICSPPLRRSGSGVEDGSSIGMPHHGFSSMAVWSNLCTFTSANCGLPERCGSPYNPQVIARPVDLPSAGIRNGDRRTREDLGYEIVGARINCYLDRRQDRIGKHDIRMQYAYSRMPPMKSKQGRGQQVVGSGLTCRV